MQSDPDASRMRAPTRLQHTPTDKVKRPRRADLHGLGNQAQKLKMAVFTTTQLPAKEGRTLRGLLQCILLTFKSPPTHTNAMRGRTDACAYFHLTYAHTHAADLCR